MTTEEIARGMILGGAGLYGFFWFWPENGRLFGPGDRWRTAPRWIRLITQRRDVGVHFYGLLSQIWALSLLAMGIAIAAGARPSSTAVQVEFGAIVVPAIVSIAIRLWRRRSTR